MIYQVGSELHIDLSIEALEAIEHMCRCYADYHGERTAAELSTFANELRSEVQHLRIIADAEALEELKLLFSIFNRNETMLTPEEQSQLELYRGRILAGEMMPADETAKALALLRSDRTNAAARANASRAKSKAKPKAPPANPMSLLAKLGINPAGTK